MDGGVTLVDVRNPGEFSHGHLPGAINIPLSQFIDRLAEISRSGPVVVHCQTGARAGIAASVLKAARFPDVRIFRGGFAEWKASGRAVAE
jgi:hydroxyacylglutathione hydrolase